jgi:hypothetical protein
VKELLLLLLFCIPLGEGTICVELIEEGKIELFCCCCCGCCCCDCIVFLGEIIRCVVKDCEFEKGKIGIGIVVVGDVEFWTFKVVDVCGVIEVPLGVVARVAVALSVFCGIVVCRVG